MYAFPSRADSPQRGAFALLYVIILRIRAKMSVCIYLAGKSGVRFSGVVLATEDRLSGFSHRFRRPRKRK